MSSELSLVVHRLRLAHGWTQQELADRLGLSRAQVANIESGNSDTPAGPLLELLAEVGWSPSPDEKDRAWTGLVAATVELGTAVARWDEARERYVGLSRGRTR